MKNIFKIGLLVMWAFIMGAGIALVLNSVAGATICFPFQGCTGIGSAVPGDVGKVLTVASTTPFFSYRLGALPAGSATTTINGINGPTFNILAGTSTVVSSSSNNITIGLPTNNISQWINNIGYISTTTGNWLGTWQNKNPSDFLSSSTSYQAPYWMLSGSNLYPSSTAYNVGIGTITPAEKLQVFGNIKLNNKFIFNPISEATALTATLIATSTGNVTDGTHIYMVTYYDTDGNQTAAGTTSNTVTVDGTHKQVALSNIPTSTDSRVVGRKIYRSFAGGIYWMYLLTTLANNTATTYTDNTADGGLGAAGTELDNTTAGRFYVGAVQFGILFKTNVGFGYNVGGALSSSAAGNVLFGNNAGYQINSGTYNVAVGFQAGSAITSGANNVVIGRQTMLNSNGSNNTAVGYYALTNITGNTGSTGLGFGAGDYTTGGSYNTFLGYSAAGNADQTLVNPSYSTALGYNSVTNKSHQMVLGDKTLVETLMYGKVGIGTTSPVSELVVNGTSTLYGHLEFSGTTPTTTACGTGATFSGISNDVVGKIVVGTGTNTCTLVFAHAWTNPPVCMIDDETSIGVFHVSSVESTTSTVLTGSSVALSGDNLHYMCVGFR